MALKELQIDKLARFLEDDLLLKTIEQVFNETLDNNLPQSQILDDNQKLGERFRAYEQAKGIIRMAFLDLMSYKTEVVQNKEIANRGK